MRHEAFNLLSKEAYKYPKQILIAGAYHIIV